jgi:hypothetical protein
MKRRDMENGSTKLKYEVQRALFLDVVVAQAAAILQLLSIEDQTLLIDGDAFLGLDLSLEVSDGGVRLQIEGECFARQGLYEDLKALVSLRF